MLRDRLRRVNAVYKGKFNPRIGRNFEILDPKELLARLLVLLPKQYELRIRYYGAASTTWRRKDKQQARQQAKDDSLESESLDNTFQKRSKKHWARMIKRVYHSDPLICRRCGGRMKIISSIDDDAVIEKILKHLHLWDPERGPPEQEEPEAEYKVEYDPGYDSAIAEDLAEL